jgi:hypothetical protein
MPVSLSRGVLVGLVSPSPSSFETWSRSPMNKFFMTALATVMLAGADTQCFAVLGETEAEIVKRYGKPDHIGLPPEVHPPAEKILMFDKPGVLISVYMWRGRAASEMYSFADVRGANSPVAQNMETAKAVALDVNAQGVEWVATRPEAMRPDMAYWWDRSDGKAMAAVSKATPHLLSIVDSEFMRESQKR